ncbi:helix-turn-helix domain-containing protein [Devosia nitrariae]|uniref:helix-turn-helix domain-containing protein n=1 Tax=Devosia nitrariae TaxID=2071872 RepID=UPI0035ED0D06
MVTVIIGKFRSHCLAARSGLSPSTVHRLLTTLEKRQFVQFDQRPTGCGTWAARLFRSARRSRSNATSSPLRFRTYAVCATRLAKRQSWSRNRRPNGLPGASGEPRDHEGDHARRRQHAHGELRHGQGSAVDLFTGRYYRDHLNLRNGRACGTSALGPPAPPLWS